MRLDTTVSGNFKRQLARSVMMVLLSLGAVNAYAQQGVLGFRGQVVNPTCEVDAALAVHLVEHTRRGPVRPGLEAKAGAVANACMAQAVPVSTHFQPLVEPDSQRGSESRGVLTVTYQ